MTTTLEKISLVNPYSYDSYKSLMHYCASNSTSTGKEKTQERIEATKLNVHRMKRLDKQIAVTDTVKNVLSNLNHKWHWVVLSESWCGDSAQCLPIIHKIVECSPNIELSIVLRDENDQLMNTHLANGTKSIPKLICFNAETMEEIGSWGPRPYEIQLMVKNYKAENPFATHDKFVKELHTWYAKDNGKSMIEEFESILNTWM